MKKSLLLRSAQRQHAITPASHFRRSGTLHNASTSHRSGEESGMALIPVLSPRRRLKLATADVNTHSYATQAQSDSSARNRHAWQGRGFKGSKNKRRDAATPATQNLPYTEDKVRASPLFPKPEQVSDTWNRRALFANPQTTLANAVENAEGTILKIEDQHIPDSRGIQSTINLSWSDNSFEPISAVGQAAGLTQGSYTKGARKVAWLSLLAKLHQTGLLDKLAPPKLTKLTGSQLKLEKSALVDVYNYCARFGELPVFERQLAGRNRGRQRASTRIMFPKHSITVQTLGTRFADSDTAACIKFKEAVERYHAAEGTESLVIKADDALTTENVSEFFTFWRLKNSTNARAQFHERPHARFPELFEGEISINGQAIGSPVMSLGKKNLESVALLSAAVHLCQENPELLGEFLDALRAGNGSILQPMPPLDCPIDDSAVLLMRDTLAKARQNGLGDQYEALGPEILANDSDITFETPAWGANHLKSRNEYLEDHRKKYLADESLSDLRKTRENLPMNHKLQEVLDIVDQNLYSIIIGETGSGKTTQVPQILLDYYTERGEGTRCNVICTQPRRIAATSVAQRVAAERGEPARSTVGHHVRGDNSRAEVAGSINYCTTGILLAQLQNDPDRVMDRTSHIIIDEVHERDKFVDYTMIILKDIIIARLEKGKPVPKVVLMSATLDPTLFAPYFKNVHADGSVTDAPTLRVPGRTFPVQEKYLDSLYTEMDRAYPSTFKNYLAGSLPTKEFIQYEREFSRENPTVGEPENSEFAASAQEEFRVIDWKRKQTVGEGEESTEYQDKLTPTRLVAATIAHIAKTTRDGAILTFLPGMDEITAVQKELQEQSPLGVDFNTDKFDLFMLHSSIDNHNTSVFNQSLPGRRKIILSTNIAETSVTIPDVQHVVDTGKSREIQYNQARRLTALTNGWISMSNARQRAGRAGRVQEGTYYAMYTRARKQSFRAVGLPELLRTDLQDTCLDIMAQKWPTPPREFLASALEPPSASAVEHAMRNLRSLDAITNQEELTPLGRLLSTLPVHPELGKMIVLGIVFRCLDPLIILGAANAARPLFVVPTPEHREQHRQKITLFAAESNSDHISVLNAFREVRAIKRSQGLRAAKDFARENLIHWGAFQMIESTAQLIESSLMQSRLIPIVAQRDRVKHQFGDGRLNVNSHKPHIVKALLAAGLYPRLAIKSNSNYMMWRTQREGQAMVHPSSVNHVGRGYKSRSIPSASSDRAKPVFAVFDQLSRSVAGDNTYLRMNTYVSPLAIALFCGRLSIRGGQGAFSLVRPNNIVEVDKWVPLFLQSDDHLVTRTVVELRKGLERMLVRAYADLSKTRLLADEPVRAVFSDGIVDILGLDVNVDGPQLRNDTRGHVRKENRFPEMSDRMMDNHRTRWQADTSGRAPANEAPRKHEDKMTLGMLEWAAKWEAKARDEQGAQKRW